LDYEGNPINLNLFGINGRYGKGLEFQIRPCIPKQLTPENKHLVDKECIADYNSPESMAAKLKESTEYLGTPALNVIYSNDHLDL